MGMPMVNLWPPFWQASSPSDSLTWYTKASQVLHCISGVFIDLSSDTSLSILQIGDTVIISDIFILQKFPILRHVHKNSLSIIKKKLQGLWEKWITIITLSN
jgi:hypothetical protein